MKHADLNDPEFIHALKTAFNEMKKDGFIPVGIIYIKENSGLLGQTTIPSLNPELTKDLDELMNYIISKFGDIEETKKIYCLPKHKQN